MTIASEIARLQGVKADILGAIAEKKVDVPTGAMLADAPDLIRSIKSGINVKIGQGVYPAVKIGNQLWLAKNLDENLGNLYTDFTKFKVNGKYIPLDGYSVGAVVDINYTVQSNSYEYLLVKLKEGDSITISAQGGGGPRAYAMLDEENKLVVKANANQLVTNFVYVAPCKGTLVIDNNKTQNTLRADNFDFANEWYYNNDEATYKKYGRLYSWNNLNTNLSKLGLTKWRWPTNADYEALIAIDSTGTKFRAKTFRNGTDDFGLSIMGSGSWWGSQKSFVNLNVFGDQATQDRSTYRFYTTLSNVGSVGANGNAIRLVMDLNDDGTIPDSNIVLEDVPATTAEPLALASEPIVTEEDK